MTTNGPLHVAVAVVGDYLPHAAAMVASLVANGEEPDLHLHLLHDGQLPPEDLAAFAGHGDRVRSPAADPPGRRQSSGWHSDRWVHHKGLLVPRSSCPSCCLRWTACSTSTPTCSCSTRCDPCATSSSAAGYLAAVTNVFEPVHVHRPAQLGLRGPDAYFNAGVLLVDLDRMRTDGMADAVLDYARANAPNLLWRDQDALNVVMGEGRVALHPRWNCMNSVMEFEEASRVFGPEAVEDARRRPAIRHFEGPSINKPWHRLADPPSQRLYRAYRRETPWPRVAVRGRHSSHPGAPAAAGPLAPYALRAAPAGARTTRPADRRPPSVRVGSVGHRC